MSLLNRLSFKSMRKLDIFGSEVALNYEKDNVFRTPFGGIVTIVMIALLSLLFFNNVTIKQLQYTQYLIIKIYKQQILILFSKSKIKTIPSVKYSTDPDLLVLDTNNFMIATKYDQSNFIEKPMVNITFEKRHYQRFTNGTYITQKIPVTLEPCTLQHFQNLPSFQVNWTQIFNQQNLKDFLCLKKGEVFQIKGRWENDDFQFLKFTMKQCQNKTVPFGTWNPVCESNEVMRKNADEDSRIQFFFVNYLISPEKSENVIQSYLESMTYTVQPEKMYSTANIFLNQQQLNTDESILPFTDINEQNFVTYTQGDFKQSYASGNFSSYSEIFFLRSSFNTIIKREFLKIDEVISYMGGFCQIFLLVSAILVSFYNDLVYTIELANRLYDFDLKNGDSNQGTNSNSTLNLKIDNGYRDKSRSINEIDRQKADSHNQKFNRKDNKKAVISRKDFGLLPLEQIKKMLDNKSPEKQYQNNYQDTLNYREISVRQQQANQTSVTMLNYQTQNSYLDISQIQNDIQFAEFQDGEKNQFNQQIRTSKKLLPQLETLNEVQTEQSGDLARSNINGEKKIQKSTLSRIELISENLNSNLILPDDSPSENNPEKMSGSSNINKLNNTIALSNPFVYEKNKKIQQQKNNQCETRSDYNLTESPIRIKDSPQLYQVNTIMNGIESSPKFGKEIPAVSDRDISHVVDRDLSPALEGQMFTVINIDRKNSFGIDKSNYTTGKLNSTLQQISCSSPNTLKNCGMKLDKSGRLDSNAFLESELKFLVQRERSISMSFRYLINRLTCGKFYDTHEVQLLKKASEMVRQDMDIFMILDRIKEIEKFKKLYLSEEQEILFNFFPKPLISIDDDTQKLSRQTLRIEVEESSVKNINDQRKKQKKLNLTFKQLAFVSKVAQKFKNLTVQNMDDKNKISNYQKLFNCYERLLIESQSNKVEFQKNKKLFDLLGDEMKEILQIAKQMKEKQNEKIFERQNERSNSFNLNNKGTMQPIILKKIPLNEIESPQISKGLQQNPIKQRKQLNSIQNQVEQYPTQKVSPRKGTITQQQNQQNDATQGEILIKFDSNEHANVGDIAVSFTE